MASRKSTGAPLAARRPYQLEEGQSEALQQIAAVNSTNESEELRRAAAAHIEANQHLLEGEPT